jgi:predicted DCC family thiol-disulfide oxidoreductase YuxK
VPRVLLFDGECGLCQALVRFLLRNDRRHRLWFAPLQGETAQAFLRERGLPTQDFATAVYVPDWASRRGEFLVRNDAVLAVLTELGGGWRALAWLRVMPRSWRDAAYRAVAWMRYRLSGAYRPRDLPAAWRERILP